MQDGDSQDSRAEGTGVLQEHSWKRILKITGLTGGRDGYPSAESIPAIELLKG